MKRKKRRARAQQREYGLAELGLANTKAIPRTVRIAASWTPKQAMAVYEILDDLINVIWRQYGRDIQRALKHDRTYNAKDFRSTGIDENNAPF